MCSESTPGWRRRYWLALPPSCSVRRLPWRRAELATQKFFRSSARWRFKNEGHALRIHQGGHQIASSANHSALKSTTSSPSNDLQRHQHCSFDLKHQLHQKPDSNLLQEVVFRRKFDVIARSKTSTGIGGLPKYAECSGRQRVPSNWKGAEY